MNKPNQIDPIDLFIGGQIRARRKMLGLSQTELGDSLGVTFQQVQKYERGVNRVSGSTLFRVTRVLRVSPAALFPPADDDESAGAIPADPTPGLLGANGGVELARAYPKLSSHHQRAVLQLATNLSDAVH